MVEELDAIVVGASTRGLVSAYVLAALGHRAVLVEPGARLGGGDASFTTAGGARFDYGMHVLDADRSPAATRLFTRVVGGAVHRQVLRRAIALRGDLMPYNPARDEMPAWLRELLPPDPLVDDVGDALPTRERLAAVYGRAFADLAFDEVLPSYPTEARHLAFGVDEARLMRNLYPWFFPRARRARVEGDASRAFHDRLRDGTPQEVLYPREGGFGGFAEGFRRSLEGSTVEVLLGTGPLDLDVDPATREVVEVRAAGRRLRARHVFWAASWPELCRRLDLPCQDAATDRVLLGSFVLDRPPLGGWHEVLVGDPAHRLNRVSFPARFRASDDPLVQVEFAVPLAEDWPTDPAWWAASWLESLRALGLLDARHAVVEQDVKAMTLHFNAFGAEGEPLRDADPALVPATSNVRPVAPSMANLNLNDHVPRTLRQVVEVLAS